MTIKESSKPQKKGCHFIVKRILSIGGAIFLLLIMAGFVYQQVSLRHDSQQYPLRGQLVDIGNYQLHLYCVGQGSPTIVFESGLGSNSIDWLMIQKSLATETQVCAYDRAGLGWSEGAGKALSIPETAQNLHTLLTNANVPAPYILVGHSLGGIFVREFYQQHPDAVAGIVLVDSSHENQTQRIAEVSGEQTNSLGPMFALLNMCRLTGPIGMVRLLQISESFIADLSYSEEARDEVIATMNRNSYCEAIQYEFELIVQLGEETRPLPNLDDIPLTVLANNITMADVLAAGLPSGITETDMQRMLDIQLELQQELADLSTSGELIPIQETHHYIHLDKPEIVLNAIREMLQESVSD